MILTESPRKEFLLVVDRDGHRGRDLAEHLRALGCYATSLTSAEEALKYASENLPDAIVADWELPDMTGTELAHRAKSQCIAAKVVLASDPADARRLRETLRCGADDLLFRPLSAEALLRTLRQEKVAGRY
jgi:DNA-binding response OmpR family regulator